MTIPTQEPVNPPSTRYESLLIRHPGNPILTSKDWPYSINSVFNPGATLLADGTTLLLCRVEDRRGLSHLSFPASTSRSKTLLEALTSWATSKVISAGIAPPASIKA